MAKLLFDTSALIEAEKGNPQAMAMIEANQCFTSAVAVMEFNEGVQPAFKQMFTSFTVLDFTAVEASLAAHKIREIRPALYTMLTEQKKSKTDIKDYMARLSMDLMIGATGLSQNMTVIHSNEKDFRWFDRLKTIYIQTV
jgi:predicted nucleic acid-binding protein